jgi:hypothetical protein
MLYAQFEMLAACTSQGSTHAIRSVVVAEHVIVVRCLIDVKGGLLGRVYGLLLRVYGLLLRAVVTFLCSPGYISCCACFACETLRVFIAILRAQVNCTGVAIVFPETKQ